MFEFFQAPWATLHISRERNACSNLSKGKTFFNYSQALKFESLKWVKHASVNSGMKETESEPEKKKLEKNWTILSLVLKVPNGRRKLSHHEVLTCSDKWHKTKLKIYMWKYICEVTWIGHHISRWNRPLVNCS